MFTPSTWSLVRPLAGAGIEIRSGRRVPEWYLFAPSRGRELKYFSLETDPDEVYVRPLAGAGIEIHFCGPKSGGSSSPPRGGGN